jgi:hypothetical protein
MIDNIDEVNNNKLIVFKEIERDKLAVAKAYNKKVNAMSF